MAKTIIFTDEYVHQHANVSILLQLVDLDIVREEYDKDSNTINLYCTHRWKVGVCPNCGQLCDQIHDYPHEREIHDCPIRGCHVKFIFNSVRLKCHKCETKFILPVRDVVPNCTYTYRLAKEIADPTRKQDVATLARIYNIGYKIVESILLKAAEGKLEERANNPIDVRYIGIDEISNKKGYGGYVLVLTDIERRILLDILPDRTKATLREWLKNPPKGINLVGLREAAIDLWWHYKDTVKEVYPNIRIVADRYHVTCNLHEVIHEERRKVQKNATTEEERKNLKGLRYILLKNKSKLTEAERKRLEKLKETHPKLYKLWLLRQELHDFYEKRMSPRAAKKFLNTWIRKAKKLNLTSLHKFCKTLKNWKKEIVNFFASRTTSGFVEGMNSKIRLLKRIAFGLPNFNHFRLRMLWACG